MAEFFFYFPALGTYSHYPVHCSKTGKDGTKVIGHGTARELRVVSKPTTPPDVTSWRYVSAHGTTQEVLSYLTTQNLYKSDVDLTEIAWRMRESQAFFKSAIAVLRQRMVYHPVMWSYALHYNEPDTVRELLPLHPSMLVAGPYFRSSLLNVDAFDYAYNSYQHFEYAPLINARAHQLKASGSNGGYGDARGGSGASATLKASDIQNVQFRAQYQRFLNYLLYRTTSRAKTPVSAQLATTYYLLLQDRNDEAVKFFANVKLAAASSASASASASSADSKAASPFAGEPELQMQYDYLSAYLDFFAPAGPTVALAIAKKYAAYPVLKKRSLFREVADQIFEATPPAAGAAPDAALHDSIGKDRDDPAAARAAEGQSRDREMASLAATEPALDLVVEPKAIDVTYANVDSATLNFYVMDLELLFSTNPFVSSKDTKFLFVSPNHSQELKFTAAAGVLRVPMPPAFATANVFVEVVGPGAGLTRVVTHYSNSVSVQTIENYGQVKVTARDTQRPVPKAYVKVYAKEKTGGSAFYKDGYTDARGRFDYASLSTSKLPNVERFSILVLTDAHGAVVREAAPPAS